MIKLIENYSDKGCALIGETFTLRNDLKALNGSFNRALKYEGLTVAGWVFSKKRLEAIRQLVLKHSNPEDIAPSESVKPALIVERDEKLENELLQLKYELDILKEQDELIEQTHPDVIICNAMPKILTLSAMEETGTKVGCNKDINIGLISNNGVTVQNASEIIFENHFYNGEFGYDCQDIRNVIIEILMVGKKAFLKSITNQNKIEILEQQIRELNLLLTH